MRKPSSGSKSDRSRIGAKIRNAFRGIHRVEENIWTVAPLILPLPNSSLIRNLNALIYTFTALTAKIFLRFKAPVLINFLPVVPATEKLWPWRTVYFCVDRWDKFAMYNSAVMGACDTACCRNADLVLTTSHDLQGRCLQKKSNSILIGHGVNYDIFSAPLRQSMPPRPDDLPDGPVIGFFGLLSEWVDQDIILSLAHRFNGGSDSPQAQIVLIGRADVDISRLENEPNIHILGPRPFDRLPQYTAFFDIAIIPFVINELTVAVNPIKLREMLAAGCPVVSTALPEVAAIKSPFVKVAGNRDEFVNATAALLQNGITLGDRKAISDTMRSETWGAKVDLMLDAINAVSNRDA